MKYNTGGEVAFGGDIFNRDNLYCYATSDCATGADTTAFTTKSVAINSLGELTDYATKADEGSWIQANTYTITNSLSELQARIDALEKKLNPRVSGLRASLKTLNYSREL